MGLYNLLFGIISVVITNRYTLVGTVKLKEKYVLLY
jgi:hypothetical protein